MNKNATVNVRPSLVDSWDLTLWEQDIPGGCSEQLRFTRKAFAGVSMTFTLTHNGVHEARYRGGPFTLTVFKTKN